MFQRIGFKGGCPKCNTCHLHVYSGPLKHFDVLSDKRCRIWSVPFHYIVPHNVVSHRLLLLNPGSCHRRQPNPILRQTLAGVKTLHRPHPLSNYMEYYLELSCNNFLVHVGRGASQYSVSQDKRGKQLYRKMGMEPTPVVC